jgi:hypothetical protein
MVVSAELLCSVLVGVVGGKGESTVRWLFSREKRREEPGQLPLVCVCFFSCQKKKLLLIMMMIKLGLKKP